MPERASWVLPLAIIAAGAILGLAIFFVRADAPGPAAEGDVALIRPVSMEDHFIGNPDAAVVLVEYSDIDCAYCKQFQETMAQVMADYADTGEVLWVYRHFPMVEIHPDAALHAEAAECAAEQGGNTAFFRFIDALQQEAPGDRAFSPSGYKRLAESIGLSGDALVACTQGSTYESHVAADFDNGIAVGVNGTPYTLILIRGHESIPVSGALPYDAMKRVVEEALAKAAQPPVAP